MEVKKGRYLLNTDGGMVNDGNFSLGDEPGEAAIGGVLSDPNDREVVSFGERIGPDTIQGAEYSGLIRGLEIASERGIDKIRAYVDNQLVVDQINGLAEVKSNHLKDLHSKTLALLQKFVDRRVYWVPRERNRRADALVREALYGPSQP